MYIYYNKSAKQTVKPMENIINDIDIIMEAITNNDLIDALQMLKDMQEDLRLFVLMG